MSIEDVTNMKATPNETAAQKVKYGTLLENGKVKSSLYLDKDTHNAIVELSEKNERHFSDEIVFRVKKSLPKKYKK